MKNGKQNGTLLFEVIIRNMKQHKLRIKNRKDCVRLSIFSINESQPGITVNFCFIIIHNATLAGKKLLT
jgi:flagellar assembly factor FliW